MNHYYLGVDDGYFRLSVKKLQGTYKTVVVGVLTNNRNIIDIFIEPITIDSLDAIPTISRIIDVALQIYNVNIVFLDGVTYAGFNIADPRRLYNLVSIPIITVFQHELELDKIFNALKSHFNNYEYRFNIIQDIYMNSIELTLKHTRNKIRIYPVGISLEQALDITQRLSKDYGVPYPLKFADRIASMIGRIIDKTMKNLNTPAR